MRQFKPGQLQTGSLYPISASYALTASYLSGSISIDTGSLLTTASFNAFTASYTTGSFTGSFKGDGSQLTGIVSSKWTGSNPISRESDVEITGSLRVQGSLTGSLFGTASWATNAVTASYVQTAQTASYILNAVSSSFATTAQNATTASYVLNAVSSSFSQTASFITTAQTASYVLQSVSASFATSALTASYVLPLRQDVQLTGSLTISGSTTQIGTNTLLGNTLLSGSLTISGSSPIGSPLPTIQIYGDIRQSGYHRFDPVITNIDTSVTASYIYVSGSTQDLYFSQNSPGYNNVTRLRWLEGNLYTGLLHGGLITTASSTIYRISSGSGIIVNLNASLANDPYPVIQFLQWGNLSASIAPLTASYQQAFVGIDTTGNIFAQGTPFSNGQFDSIINIGGVFFQNQSTINGVKTQPSVAYGFEQQQNVFNRAFGPLKLSGYTLAPSGSSTGSLIVASGTAYAPGSNYAVDPNEPYYTVDNGTNVSKIFRYHQSGSTWVYNTNGGAGFATINPSQYSNNGTLTTVQPNDWSIQRVFWFPNSVIKAIVVYYGNQSYSTEADAIANINIESFVEAPNTSANAIYLGAIIIRGNGVLTTPADFTIVPGGLFRQVGGSGGGGSIITQTLSGLSDVSISGPLNGQPLVYNNTSGKWQNLSTLTADLTGNASTATSASFASTASYIVTAQTASYVLNAVSASFATVANSVNDLNQNVYISGSLTVVGPATFYGSASFVNVTASNLYVSESFISVNVFEPVERFGGLKVYDSGSSTATASLAWDSLHNHWVYQNVSGSTYSGGMLLSGPRNTGSLGDEPNLTKWRIPRSDGGDHLDDSQIYSSGSVTIVTGSLTVTEGITGSLFGTATTATTASHALQSNTILPLGGDTQTGFISYVNSTGSFQYVKGYHRFNIDIALGGATTVNLTGSLIASSITGSLQGTASNAVSASWAPAGGSNSYIQFNDSGSFGGSDSLYFNRTIASLANGKGVKVKGQWSHAQGDATTAIGRLSHAEGSQTTTGMSAYSCSINAGVVEIDATLGDLTSTYADGTTIWWGDIAAVGNGITKGIVTGSMFNGTNTVFQLLNDNSTTIAAAGIVDKSGNVADQLGGTYAHAEGSSASAIGDASHAEGEGNSAYGYASHAEGASVVSIGQYSHAEGGSTTSGYNAYSTVNIAAGVITFASYYGDLSATFTPGTVIYVEDATQYAVLIHEVASVSINGNGETEVTLVDTTYDPQAANYVGVQGQSQPTYADQTIGNSSHAEGESTITLGYGSHAAGIGTITHGYYQSVVGRYNAPVPQSSSFVIGDGADSANLHNLLVAGNGVVTISGSLTVSGSSTFRNIGLAEFTGSVVADAVTGSFTGSFVGDGSGLTGVGATEYIRRSDYTSSLDPNVNYLYTGYAPVGSAESATVWTLSRLAISASGDTITQVTASAAWTDRYIVTYL